jgi:PAS domain S-box-containing protein
MDKISVLVVEDNAITRKMFRLALESVGYNVLEAPDGKSALRLATEGPSLIVQDLLLPDIDGLDLVNQLRAALPNPQIPILACTGLMSKIQEARTLQGGFTDYLFKPVAPSQLLQTIQGYLITPAAAPRNTEAKIKVLLVDDDPVELKLEKLVLEAEGFDVITATDGKEAWETAQELRPGAVLCDLVMPRMTGFDLCMALRKDPRFSTLPIVITSSSVSYIGEEDRKLAEKVGADAFVVRTPDLKEVVEALRAALIRPSHPQPTSDSETLKDNYVQRLIAHLEHQTSHNTEMMRRSAEQKAHLAVVARITATLNKKLPLQAALDEALALILDVAGSSLGAIFLADPNGKLSLRSQIGFNDSEWDELQNLFGYSDFLYRALEQRKPLTTTTPQIVRNSNGDAHKNINAPSLLIAPLLAADEPQGVLVVFSSHSGLDNEWVNSVDTVTSQLAQAVLLARTLARVSESEQRFRELAENIREIFFVAGCGGSPVHYVSPAYERITGYKCADLYRDPLAWLAHIHPDDRARVEQALRSDPVNLDQEYRIVKATGELRYLHLRAFPVRGENGEVVHTVGIIEDVTERKLAEAQTRVQMAALKSAANSIVITDRDGLVTWVNPAFSKLTGYSSQEVIGKNPSLLKSGAQDRQFYRDLWNTILSGSVWSGNIVNRRKDGSLYTEEQSITPVRDNEGEISHFIAIKQDVTDRKRAEAEVQRNLERIHALYEIDLAIGSTLDLHAIVAVLLEKIELFVPIAAVTTVRLYNPRTGELEALACRGLNEDEWKAEQGGLPTRTGQRVAETKSPLTVLNLLTSTLTVNPEVIRKRGLISYLGVPLIAHDQVLGVLNLYTRQEHEFTDEEIEFFKTLAGRAAIAIDNAQLYEAVIRAKSGLEISNGYLNRSLRQLSSLYTALGPLEPKKSTQATMAGIVERLMEATGADAALIRLWDKQTGAYLITGHRGFTDEYLERVNAAHVAGAVKWVVEHGEPIIAPDIASEPRFKGKVQLKQGLRSCAVLPLKVQNEVRGIFHIASRKLGYFDEEQKLHLTAIARQMGIALENKEMFDNLRASRDELEKANKIKDDFLSVMSHELKTPLVVVIGYAELLKNGAIGALNQEQQEALERMLGSTSEQLNIINNILETIQLEANTIVPTYQLVDVQDLIETLKSEYDSRANNKGVKLGCRHSATPFQIITDPAMLKQILHNLINNAIKFTNRGSVTLSARKVGNGKKVEFSVSDTGIGIPKETQEAIFEKFYQLDNTDTRRYGGVGLGLHIVKELTDFLHGEVQVESEPRKGSSFTVRIPNAKIAARE